MPQQMVRRTGRAQTLALAAAAGLAAALLAYVALARQTRGVADGRGAVPVVVAARGLPLRQTLTAAMLRVRHLPPADVPPGAVAAPEALAGEVTAVTVAEGQPVTRSMVTTRSASPGLAWNITPSQRAISVALDPVSGAAGFLEPGDHVDVLATFEGGGGLAVTRTILQNARLLALGPHTEAAPADADITDKPATSATLEVSPPEAQALAMAAARGKLQLALRGLADAEESPIPALSSVTENAPPAPNPGEAGKEEARVIHPAPVVIVKKRPAPPELGSGTILAPPLSAGEAGRGSPSPPLPRVTVIRGTEKTTMEVGE